ncbi:NTP transferase domain-containing protein [Verrucomicrobiota bacterium]
MAGRSPDFSLILAAGKGTRMGSSSLHKVCFPIDGKPAILRAIESYVASGIRRHVVVVGAMAGQVVETVGRHFGDAIFAYQAEQLGTAHAARVGLNAIGFAGGDRDILLVAGDRIIERSVLERFFDAYYSGRCDLALLACPAREGSDQGRILTGSGGARSGDRGDGRRAPAPGLRGNPVSGVGRECPGQGVPAESTAGRLLRAGWNSAGRQAGEGIREAVAGSLTGEPRAEPRGDPGMRARGGNEV